MKLLKVPYIEQINDYACGAAVLEMIYKYYGLDNIDQISLYDKYKELEPHGSGNNRMTTENLVKDAQTRGLSAQWKRVDYLNTSTAIKSLKKLIKDKKPIIVCQQFTKNSDLGHFRIVLGIGKDSLYLHDPYPGIKGKNAKWSINKFMEYWQPTGLNVIGGIYCNIFSQT